MDFAEDRGLCRMLVINKIDSRDAHPEQLLAELRARFGVQCLPLNLPGENGNSVLDCFFRPDGKAADFSSVDAAHTQILDQVVEVDEDLMARYLDKGGDLPPEELHDSFEKALREGHLVPVCFTSAETGAGIPELLDIITRLLPNPMEGNPPPFLKGPGDDAIRVSVAPNPEDHVVAHVFKVSVDPYVGKLGIFRIHQGTVRPGAQLFVGDARKAFRVAHLYRVLGKETSEVPLGIPGDICGISKVDEIRFDDVLHDSHDEDNYHLRSIHFPPPMHGLAIEPERRGDEQRLADALHKLTAEDPCVRIEHHAALNETVLYGMGEFHLRVLLERMTERYGVHIKTHLPSIPYRETITRQADGHCRHKKQTGGAGQFGEVYLRIEPMPRGAGFEFVDQVKGGAIPNTLIPAVQKGVEQVLTSGPVAGFPMQDVRVIVYDGKYHPVDSKEVAFVAAGRKAFLDAITKARPIVLEPIVGVEINCPANTMGDVAGDLSSRRGQVTGTQTLQANMLAVNGYAPLAELDGYAARLKSMTGGHGAWTMSLSHYEQAPPNLQNQLSSEYAKHRRHEEE
jgi:elongation factor G